MMPTDPTRRSALSVALLAHTGTDYEVDAWLAGDGQANGSVRFDSDRAWFTIQGRPPTWRQPVGWGALHETPPVITAPVVRERPADWLFNGILRPAWAYRLELV